MERAIQCDINRYICSRMLEDECDYSKVHLNTAYEDFYKLLKRYYKPTAILSSKRFSELKAQDLNEAAYYKVIRSSLYARDMGPLCMKTLIIVYVVTKHLVVHYNKDKQGFYYCIWMNNLLNDSDINWNVIADRNDRLDNSCILL